LLFHLSSFIVLYILEEEALFAATENSNYYDRRLGLFLGDINLTGGVKKEVEAVIRFTCPQCNQKIKVDDRYGGKRGFCPKCKSELHVPERPAQAVEGKRELIKFRCPSCNQKIGVDKKYAGKRAKCSKCKQPMMIPTVTEPVVTGSTVIESGRSNILDSGIGSRAFEDNLPADQLTKERVDDGPLGLTDEEEQEEAEPKVSKAFMGDYYLFRKKVFKIFGGAFHAYDAEGQLILYSEQKAFKLKEDFRIYSDERQMEELLTIKTPQILDIGATYNVFDPGAMEMVGALRRKGLKSILKDEWVFLSPEGQQIGVLTETSLFGALASRVVNLIPQKYIIKSLSGQEVAEIKQHFNPFILKYSLNIFGSDKSIDRRLLVSAGILLAAIEGRQQ
jgi:uncharacterized protein YxjI/Zn finger protein HypA/HybF involved in hydrogenase expression